MEVALVSRSAIDTTTEAHTTVDTGTVDSAVTDSAVIGGFAAIAEASEASADIEAVDLSRAVVSGTEEKQFEFVLCRRAIALAPVAIFRVSDLASCDVSVLLVPSMIR